MLQPGKKISHRFFLAIIAIVVLPIGVMGYESYILAKKTLIFLAFQHMATVSENKVNHLDSWLEERLDDVGVLARLPVIRETCRQFRESESRPAEIAVEVLKDTLELIEGTSPSYENLHILLPAGSILSSTHPELVHTRGAYAREVIERARSSETPVLGPAYQIPGTRGWRVQLASGIRDQDGTLLGTLVATVDISKTIDPIMVDRVGLGETGETYLVSKERRIISELRFLDWGETADRSFESRGILAALAGQSGTAVYESYMGREVLGSYAWLPRYEWGILAEIETEEIMGPLAWIKAIGVATSLLVGLVCLLMAFVVSRRVSMPIVQVAEASKRISEGDLDQRIPFSSNDEVGTLAGSFNAMTQQLKQTMTSLRLKEESLQKAYNELITAQEQLLRSERMAAIGELVASIAHEMRSPLSSIRLNLQIIGRALDHESDLHEHYEIAFDQVLQMERMFSDLLNYSKPVDIQRRDVSAATVIEKSLKEIEGELSAKNIRVERDIPADLPPIIGDPDKIEQVIINVLKNALEGSPPEHPILISAAAQEDVSGTTVKITVVDQGEGISARNLRVVFQPFFTTKKKGTGLGLPIVKKIMDAHRADIDIESEEGAGTCVRLSFPSVRGVK